MSIDLLFNKKIAIDARFLAPYHGGLARYTRELCKALITLDVSFKLIIIAREGDEFPADLKKIVDNNGEKVEVVGTSAGHYTLSEQTEMLKLLNFLDADLVHFTNFNHPVRYKKPFVVTVHDLTLMQFSQNSPWYKRKLGDFVMKKALYNSKLLFTVSEYSKKDIAKTYHIPLSKFVVTYNGIDQKRFHPITNGKILQDAAKKYKIDKQFILYVGHWTAHKNLGRLVEAFKLIEQSREYGGQYQLVFTGKPRQFYEELQKKVNDLHLEKSVILPGFVDDEDLPLLYNAARLFAFPSLSEGFGIPPLEAMACGTPVVSSNKTSLPEVLGEAALYFDPTDIKKMAQVIVRVLTDAKQRDKLSKLGIEQVAKYSWASTAQETMEGYRRAIAL